MHRPIEGFVKRLTIRRSATNKWYVSFLVEESIDHVIEPSDRVVGIDVGDQNFAVFCNGEFIENPRFLLLMKESSRKPKANAIAAQRFSREIKQINQSTISMNGLLTGERILLSNSVTCLNLLWHNMF